MMLADYQQLLCSYIAFRDIREEPPEYFLSPAFMQNILILQEIVLFWLDLSLKRSTPLTSRFLDRMGLFQTSMTSYIRENGLLAFEEDLRDSFLGYVSRSENTLVAAIAAFERALLATAIDKTLVFKIEWPCDPRPIILSLLAGSSPVPELQGRPFLVTVTNTLPGGFSAQPIL